MDSRAGGPPRRVVALIALLERTLPTATKGPHRQAPAGSGPCVARGLSCRAPPGPGPTPRPCQCPRRSPCHHRPATVSFSAGSSCRPDKAPMLSLSRRGGELRDAPAPCSRRSRPGWAQAHSLTWPAAGQVAKQPAQQAWRARQGQAWCWALAGHALAHGQCVQAGYKRTPWLPRCPAPGSMPGRRGAGSSACPARATCASARAGSASRWPARW